MPRFKVNRWWILILTLSLGCVFVASLSARASAESRLPDEMGQRNWGGGGCQDPPPGDGDPDTPMSSLKRSQPNAMGQPAARISTVPVAGDGMPVDGVMMWHFRIVLQSVRLWGFVRF